jgi:hypothetical protein
MVKTYLTDRMRLGGATLVQKLDESGLKPSSALWLYSSDDESWKLVIATKQVSEKGPLDVYGQIQKVFQESQKELEGISFFDVTVVNPDSPIVSILRTAVHTDNGIQEIRLTNNSFAGTMIEDALLYRST